MVGTVQAGPSVATGPPSEVVQGFVEEVRGSVKEIKRVWGEWKGVEGRDGQDRRGGEGGKQASKQGSE